MAGWGCLLVLAGWGLEASAQDDAVNFKVPKINERGQVESVMTGDRAQLRPGKPIIIHGMKIEFFEEDGETVKMTVTSPACVYDARKREAASEEAIDIRGEAYQVEGKGYRYFMERDRMEIFNDVRVRFRGKARDPGDDAEQDANQDTEQDPPGEPRDETTEPSS